MGEIKNHVDETGEKNRPYDNYDPDHRLDVQSYVAEHLFHDKYDPDKRMEISKPENNVLEEKFEKLKTFIENIDKKLDNMLIEDIMSAPFEFFIEKDKDVPLDTIVISSGYVTSCKIACGELKKADSVGDIEQSLKAFFSAPELANKFIQEYGIGPDRLKEAAGETAEFILELGKGIFYVSTRLSLGVLQIADNACRAVFSMGLYVLGKSEDAKDLMTDSKLDKFREYLDRIVQPNSVEMGIKDIADKAGETVGELALAIVGALGISASAPIAAVGIVSAMALVGFDEASKSLERNIEKSGEYGKKEFISALSTAALAITVERIMPCIGKISKEANIIKVADKVSKYAQGNMELGAKLTKSILTSLQAGAGMSAFKGADEIKKVIDYELGIEDRLDIKKEILETFGFVLGAAALGGGLSFIGDTVVRSKTFQELAKRINKDVIFDETKYDVIYKRVELAKEYYSDIINNSTVPETIAKDLLKAEELYKEPAEVVAQKRQEFKNVKSKLVEEWEKNTGKEWPRYTEDVYITLKDDSKVLIRRAGDLFDAHHIKPLSWGGENIWENITPLHADIHFDSRGVHAIDSAFDKLSKVMGELL